MPGSQAWMGTVVRMGGPCWRCVKHGVQCIMLSGRARCENCRAKHYGCSLMPPKEVVGGKGGPLGSQKAKVAEGSQQVKGWAWKAQKAITLGKFYPSKCRHR